MHWNWWYHLSNCFIFSFKSYTAPFAPVDCSEIPLSFNGFSCVAHNIANATPTSKLHTARCLKRLWLVDVFWISPRPDSPVGSYQFPVIIRSCDQISLVRPHFCNQQNTDLRSAHNTHTGTQLAWAHIKVMWSSREKELGNACCRHSMPWSNAIFKRRCQTVANGCQPRNQGGFFAEIQTAIQW